MAISQLRPGRTRVRITNSLLGSSKGFGKEGTFLRWHNGRLVVKLDNLPDPVHFRHADVRIVGHLPGHTPGHTPH